MYTKNYRQFIRGDNHFIKMVYEQYYKLLLLVAYKYLNDKEDAKDAVSQVIQKLLEMTSDKRQKYLPEDADDFIKYARIMVVNCCLDYIKTKNNQYKLAKDHFVLREINNWDETEEFVEKEAFLHLKENLTKAEIKIIDLHLIGHKNEEIAEQLSLSYNTVRNTISIAKNKLRTQYKLLYQS